MPVPLVSIRDLAVSFAGLPDMIGPRHRLEAIPGQLPEPWNLPAGCAFAPRCTQAGPDCAAGQPGFRGAGNNHFAACLRVPAREALPA